MKYAILICRRTLQCLLVIFEIECMNRSNALHDVNDVSDCAMHGSTKSQRHV